MQGLLKQNKPRIAELSSGEAPKRVQRTQSTGDMAGGLVCG